MTARQMIIIWGLSFVLSVQICLYWGAVKDHSKWIKDYNERQYSTDDIGCRKAKRPYEKGYQF